MVNEKKDSPEQAVGYQIDPKPSSKIDKGHNAGLVPLNLPQPLSLDEKKYLLAVERGDIASVRRILQRAHRKHHLNINCMDPLGRRALSVAIDSENLEMVELLVIMGVETKDALLQAINAEFVEAVELLLEHEELIYNEGDQYSWQKVDINTAMFAPDITPLILAAHKNNFEILKLLLDRGAAVPIPHDIRCGCEECVRQSTQDSLRHSLSRVNIYKALASPSFICLTSSDPILTAFQLSWELRSIASTEQECKSEYVELRRQCQKFAVDLLDETRSSQELAIILNHDPDAPPYADGDRMTLARLVQAINFKQKKFVAHPNIQQLLAAIWYEGVPGFRRKSVLEKLLTIVQVAVLFPVYCVMYMIAPTNSTGILMRKPFMKFLIHASSYLFFLLILILVSQRAEDFAIEFFGTDEMKENLQQRTKRQRGNGPGSLELLVALYVTGFIWEEIQEIYNVGIKSYLRNMWNFIDFTRNTLYVSVMCLRILAYLQQSSEIAENPQMAYIPREDWDDFDPQLIAEGLFAAANVFSALKLVHLFSINPHLGPLQISLGRMVIDIVKFFFIYSLLLFAFACGLNQLLWYFADLEKKKCYHLPNNQADWAGNSDACMKWRRFGNLFESSQSLFWASFGMVGLENFELQGIKSYTRFWGLLMFGSYSVINVIVLLNLLIAMMSNSYAMIELHSDTEWKFARTKLWMSYFDNSATLPPPFNILPSVKWLIRLFRKSSHAIELKKSLKRAEAAEQRYHNIMRALVWRYVSSKQRKCEDSLVTEDDINEVKTEISAMRYEILEIFDDNGMDVSSAAKKEKPVRAKRAKIWERRLMKDFHVAPVPSATAGTNTDDDDMSEIKIETEPSAPQGPPLNEAPKAKFIRVAKQVASDSIAHKWNAVLQGVAKNSQIGRCNDKKSYENLQNLEKAIEEARKLIMFSPPPRSGAISPIDFDDEKSSTLLGLLNKISAELDPQSNQNELTGVMKQLTADSQLKLQKIKKTPVQQDLKSKNIVNERNSITINPSTALNKITTDRVAQNVPGSAVKAPHIKVIKPDEEVVLSAEALAKSQSQIKTIPTGPSQTTSQLKPALKKAPPPPPTQISSSDTPKDVSVKQMGHSKVHPSDHQQVNPPGANKRREPQHDSFDIQVMSLNDSHEVLVNRPSSPDSDCSSVTASPRNKVGGVRGPQPKSGWL